jgi:hypothetical protein
VRELLRDDAAAWNPADRLGTGALRACEPVEPRELGPFASEPLYPATLTSLPAQRNLSTPQT